MTDWSHTGTRPRPHARSHHRCTGLNALAGAFLAVASSGTAAADAPVFRCAQPDGRVLYTDVPCAGGAQVDIHPGKADPAAAERLARAQALLDAAAAQRKADLAREAAQRQQYAQMRDAAAAAAAAATPPDTSGYGFDYYGSGYGYVPVYGGSVKPRPPRPRPPLPLPGERVVAAQAKNLPTIRTIVRR